MALLFRLRTAGVWLGAVYISTLLTAQAPAQQSPAWIYYGEEDPMAAKASRIAQVVSTNKFELNFPYQGAQHAALTLRNHPRYGKDLMLMIEKGQFICRSYNGCSVLTRFDDGTPQQFSAVGPDDMSTTVLFIKNYERFLSNMTKANRVRISASIFHHGDFVFEFDVSGFDAKAFADTK